jgi:hypothetical protein
MDSLADRILELEDYEPAESTETKRFLQVDEQETYELVEAQRNESTQQVTACHLRLFTAWLRQQNELRQPEYIEPKDLDLHLTQFFLGVRKEGNEDLNDLHRQYEPLTLTAMHSSIDRYLSVKGYQGNLKADDAFRHSRGVLAAKQKELKQLRKGNKPRATQPFTDDELDICFERHLLGTGTVVYLLFARWQQTFAFFIFSLIFFYFTGNHDAV